MSEEAQTEVESNPIQDMINHAIDQNFNKATDVFNDMMTVKMSDLLDQEKISLAGQIYNGEEPEEDDQLELDLEAEDGAEEESDEDLQEPDSEDEEVEDNSDEWEDASFEEDDEEENSSQ